MELSLRPYQSEIVDKVLKSDSKRQLVVLPTGTGKTIVFAFIAKRLNGKCMILAHRDELINQAVDKVKMVWNDVSIGVVKAERHETDCQVTVASVQSLHQQRLSTMPNDYDLIVTDEAHHATANSYQRIYDKYGLLWNITNDSIPLHIGVTATPNRTDKKLLGGTYDDVTYEKDILSFIPEYLSDIRIVRRQSGVVLDGIAKTTNDLNCNELSDLLNTPEGNSLSVDFWLETAKDRYKTLAFCADIRHVHDLARMFNAAGITAAGIDSNMHITERRSILKDFDDGNIQVLTNCGILTEGYDCPSIDCILLNRPTRSELLLRQMIGRGTRQYPGKDNCLMLDIACVSKDWDLVSPTQLFGIEPTETEIDVREEVDKLSDGRMRHSWDKIDISKGVDGIYDTRSPGVLEWRKLRWKGWLLELGNDGKIRITCKTDLSDIDKYSVKHEPNKKAKYSKVKPGTELDVTDLNLEMAFSYAESYVREHKLNTKFVKQGNWQKGNPTDKQIDLIQRLGAGDQLKDGITKGECAKLISYLLDSRKR